MEKILSIRTHQHQMNSNTINQIAHSIGESNIQLLMEIANRIGETRLRLLCLEAQKISILESPLIPGSKTPKSVGGILFSVVMKNPRFIDDAEYLHIFKKLRT